MLNSKIYRLLTGKLIHKTVDGKETTREMIWNKVEYASADFNKAYKMYDRLVAEGYQYLMMVIDFGVMPTGQYLVQAAGKFNVGTKFNQLVPYIVVAECLEGHSTSYLSGPEFLVTTKGQSHYYNDIRKAMKHFMAVVDGHEDAKIEEIRHLSDKFHADEYTEVRTVATAKAIRTAEKYHPCGKIRTIVTHYYEGWSYDQIKEYEAMEAAIA